MSEEKTCAGCIHSGLCYFNITYRQVHSIFMERISAEDLAKEETTPAIENAIALTKSFDKFMKNCPRFVPIS